MEVLIIDMRHVGGYQVNGLTLYLGTQYHGASEVHGNLQ